MKDKVDKLIAKFLSNELTEHEAKQFKIWLSEPGNQAVLKEKIELYHLINASNQTFDADAAYQKHLLQSRVAAVEVAPVRRLWPRYASAAAVVLALGFFIYRNTHNNNQAKAPELTQQREILPGSTKAILTLGNGRKVVLEDLQGAINLDANHQLANDTSGLISYTHVGSLADPAAYHTIEIPNGGTYQIILSDGTKVWLNAASKLTFPVVYSGSERVVELEGEAYFEVTKNPLKKFKVKSRGQEIQVLGTKFNISAYNDDDIAKTTLLEGSVKIASAKQSVVLHPNQVSINTNDGISVQNADAQEAIAWKNGYFQFENEALESVMRKIARWYDIEVEFVGDSAHQKFNGNLSRTKTLKNTLKIMEATENIRFKLEGRKLIVKT